MFENCDELFSSSFSTRYFTLNRNPFSGRTFICDEDLQICIKETAPKKKNHDHALLEMLIKYHRQKEKKNTLPRGKINKMEICRELADVKETYQEMMLVKNILNLSYNDLVK